MVVQSYNESRGDVVHELIARADLKGYITFEDLIEVVGDDIDDTAFLEGLLDELEELGIEVRQDDSEPDGEDRGDEEVEEELDDTPMPDIDAVSADDPVGLYFRQMAQEPLLTAEEEIDLAKRIEVGNKARERLEVNNDLGTEERVELEMRVWEAQSAREHLGRANTRLVVSIAKRYMGQGLPFPDLIQEGGQDHRLAHTHRAGESDQSCPLLNPVDEPGQGFPVTLGQVEVPGVRGQVEGLFVQAEERHIHDCYSQVELVCAS